MTYLAVTMLMCSGAFLPCGDGLGSGDVSFALLLGGILAFVIGGL